MTYEGEERGRGGAAATGQSQSIQRHRLDEGRSEAATGDVGGDGEATVNRRRGRQKGRKIGAIRRPSAAAELGIIREWSASLNSH